MARGRIVLDGKSKEDLEKIVEYSSSFWCSHPFGLRVIILNWSNNRDYVLGKAGFVRAKKTWLQFWWKIGSVFAKQVRLWENQPPTLGNEPPTLGKWATDFGKLRSWEKTGFVFWGKNASVFGRKVWENWFGFWIGLGQNSSLTVLNA